MSLFKMFLERLSQLLKLPAPNSVAKRLSNGFYNYLQKNLSFLAI